MTQCYVFDKVLKKHDFKICLFHVSGATPDLSPPNVKDALQFLNYTIQAALLEKPEAAEPPVKMEREVAAFSC